MSHHEEFTDRLSDYLDGELPPDEQLAVESHLNGCPACAAVLAELRAVVQRTGRLEPRPPQADLWPGISARIEGASANVMPFLLRTPRHVTFTLPQLAAASLLIAAVSGGLVWSLPRGSAVEMARSAEASRPVDPQSTASSVVERQPFAEGVAEPVALADQQYDAAVADLEQALKLGRGRLDTATIAIVEHNLTTIDEAIRQAREALAADPSNSYLSSHLVEARRRKLDLLRRATALASDMD